MATAVAKGLLRIGPKSGHEPELPAGIATLGTRLPSLGYHVSAGPQSSTTGFVRCHLPFSATFYDLASNADEAVNLAGKRT